LQQHRIEAFSKRKQRTLEDKGVEHLAVGACASLIAALVLVRPKKTTEPEARQFIVRHSQSVESCQSQTIESGPSRMRVTQQSEHKLHTRSVHAKSAPFGSNQSVVKSDLASYANVEGSQRVGKSALVDVERSTSKLTAPYSVRRARSIDWKRKARRTRSVNEIEA